MLETITRIDQKSQNPFVPCDRMNCCLQKYTTHQFTYYIYYLVQDKIKIQKLCKSNKYTKSYKQNNFYLYIFIFFYL